MQQGMAWFSQEKKIGRGELKGNECKTAVECACWWRQQGVLAGSEVTCGAGGAVRVSSARLWGGLSCAWLAIPERRFCVIFRAQSKKVTPEITGERNKRFRGFGIFFWWILKFVCSNETLWGKNTILFIHCRIWKKKQVSLLSISNAQYTAELLFFFIASGNPLCMFTFQPGFQTVTTAVTM